MPAARKRLIPTEADVNPSPKKDGADGVRAQQAQATRRALVEAARELFTERGYHNVGIREFAAKANVTRGALYHHFGDKESLFLAVFDAVEREMMGEGAQRRRAKSSDDAWTQFKRGIQAYLDAVMRPEVQRITLIDGPAVLGWARWRKLEEGYGLGGITNVLEGAMKDGLIRQQPVEPLAHLLLGSVMEAALLSPTRTSPGSDARKWARPWTAC